MTAVYAQGKPLTFPAGEDLRTFQFRGVRLNSSGQVVTMDAITDVPFGVLQNAPNLGEDASVIPLGSHGSKVELGATLDPGARFSFGATGLAVAAAATAYPAGTIIEGGANGELGSAWLLPMTVQAA